MKEKTFLHLHRNDVSMTLGGASIGHPLSIHSASIGNRWNIRGMKYVSMLLMALFLCVGNVWGTKISDCKLAQNAIDQNYPVPGVRYYVYATNPNTTSNYKDQVVFWTCATSTNSYQIKQTVPQDTTTNKNVPADALIVRIKVENNKPYIEADVDGNGTYKKLFFP